MGIIYVDGEPGAVQLWIVQHGNALIYKLAHDEPFGGLVRRHDALRHHFQHAPGVDTVTEADYLSRDAAYE
jgi:hypothetical protein